LYELLETKIFEYFFSEDVMVGYNLNKVNIYPENNDLYSNDFFLRDAISFQNIGNQYQL
jgi:hypothetical protein